MVTSPFGSCGELHSRFPLASTLIALIERIWSDYIVEYPELRPAFIRFDRFKRSQGYVLTRCASVKYPNGEVYHEVLIRDDLFDLTAKDFYQAILHSIVHCLNYDRGINDTTGRLFHTEEFRKTAHELGLKTVWTEKFGYMTMLDDNFKPGSKAEKARLAHIRFIQKLKPVRTTPGAISA